MHTLSRHSFSLLERFALSLQWYPQIQTPTPLRKCWGNVEARLYNLPVELVEPIAAALEITDMFSLRLVCRLLYQKTFHYFARRCYTTVRTELSGDGLHALQELSKMEHLRLYVQVLHIRRMDDDYGRGFAWPRLPSGRLSTPIAAIQMLEDILRNFKNCKSFRILFTFDDGAYTGDRVTGSDVVAIILSIVATIGLPVKAFSLDNTNPPSPIDMRRLDMTLYGRPEFKSAWAHLQELSLEPMVTSDSVNWLVKLIAYAATLQKLSLMCGFEFSESLIGSLTSAGTLPALRELRLACFSLTADMLSRFLFRFRDSLRTLTLFAARMEFPDRWVSALRSWKCDLPLLESLTVSIMRERISPQSRTAMKRVIFTLPDDLEVHGCPGRRFHNLLYHNVRQKRRVTGVSYEGPDMAMALETLAESAKSVRIGY